MNQLFYGDNLQILRERFATESIDLVYLDPPFNSQASYNVLFKAHTGEQLQAQIEAFEDTWHWNDHAESAFGQRRQPTQDGRPLRRYRRRWRVERLFAWLHHFRRLVIRWEYHIENFFGMVRLGCMQILFRYL